jgi:prepilin-type N-terminal cleavage/methylation domain-containing protein
MKTRGFTLVEMIVVVTIIMLITSVGLYQYNKASERSRDADRQSNLSKVQAAIELYKQRNGRYPAGCNGPGVWSGQLGTSYACSNGDSRYIVGLAPDFTPTLPQERRLNGTDSGYVYTVDTAGTVYKFEAKKTVEKADYDPGGVGVQTGDKYASCDVNDSEHPDGGICVRVASQGYNTPDWCQDYNTTFQTSYAVWGGYANSSSQVVIEQNTENIICAVQ